MIGAVLEFDDSRKNSPSSELLDELARVYARAAARAYFAKLMEEEAQGRESRAAHLPARETAKAGSELRGVANAG